MTHVPVLMMEVIKLLEVKSEGIYVDATLGGGGHAQAILEASGPGGKLIGLDWDLEAIQFSEKRLKPYSERVRLFQTSFLEIEKVLEECQDWIPLEGNEMVDLQKRMPESPIQVDGILFDLGVSSFQIELPERGFSYRKEGPLDMRMDRRLKRTARDLVNLSSVETLSGILRTYGEERFAKRIANTIDRERRKSPIEGTLELAEIVRSAVPRPKAHKSIARVFQAIRIFVNQELDQLRVGLERAFEFLRPARRIGVISYHSLEDRIVKGIFRTLEEEGRMRWVTKKVVKPTSSEIERNRRARGAKLRVGEKVQLK